MDELAIAEVFYTDQRPHAEVLGSLVQTVLRLPADTALFRSEEATLVLGPSFVLSVVEGEGAAIDAIRRRLQAGPGRIRSAPGYLFFSLIDMSLDLWFPAVERYGDKMEVLEARILDGSDDGLATEVHRLKSRLDESSVAGHRPPKALQGSSSFAMPRAYDWRQLG